MSKSQKIFSLFSSLLLFPCISSAALGERPSLKDLVGKIQKEEIIKAQIPKKPADGRAVKNLIQANQSLLKSFYQHARESSAFVRGELEDEKVLNGLTRLLQISILECRLQIQEKQANACADSVPTWFSFVADLSYEETTLVGIRFAHVVRSLWMDELELEVPKNPDFAASAQVWTKLLRAPWPVDRVFLYEGKRVLHPASLRIVEKMALEYQKNPYQTADQLMSRVPGAKPQELDFIKKIWRAEDLASLKQEVNRISRLKVATAMAAFQKNKNKKPAGFEDLMQAGLLDKAPIDYETGRPLEFPKNSAL